MMTDQTPRTENCRTCDLTYPAGTEHRCTDGWTDQTPRTEAGRRVQAEWPHADVLAIEAEAREQDRQRLGELVVKYRDLYAELLEARADERKRLAERVRTLRETFVPSLDDRYMMGGYDALGTVLAILTETER